MSLDIPSDGGNSSGFATIPDVPLVSASDRVNPNQVSTGTNRGSQVVVGSDGHPQVLSGTQPKFGNGFYVAKPGKDVTTTIDPADFIFNSNQNTFKIVASGTVQVSSAFGALTGPINKGSDKLSTLVTHGLGYVPGIIAYYSENNGNTYFPVTDGSIYDAQFGSNFAMVKTHGIQVGNTGILFTFYRDYWLDSTTTITVGTGYFTYKYYLLQETAN